MCLRLFTFIHVNLLYCIVLYCSARTDTHPHGDFVGYLARRTAGTAMSNCWQTSGPNGWWEMGGWTTSIYCAPEGGLSVVKRGTPLWARVFLFYEKCVIKLILNFAWLSFFFLFFFCPRTTFHPHGTVSTLWSCRCHAHQRPVITLSLWRPVVLTSWRPVAIVARQQQRTLKSWALMDLTFRRVSAVSWTESPTICISLKGFRAVSGSNGMGLLEWVDGGSKGFNTSTLCSSS